MVAEMLGVDPDSNPEDYRPRYNVAPIHDRMPVVLDERGTDDWMNPLERDSRALNQLLVPAPDDALIA